MEAVPVISLQLDTHVALWLYDEPSRFIPAAVVEALTGAALAVSPMVVLEMGYLHEIGRIAPGPATILASLAGTVGLAIDPTPFAQIVEVAIGVTWTRDPFDRLIVAQALAAGAQLVTADRRILEHCTSAIWAEPAAS